jgi:geranylgeranyl pyrophosphate synthase
LIKRAVEEKEQDEKAISDIVSMMHRHDGINYSLNKAKTYIGEAKGYLESFEDSKPKESLLAISDYIIERNI